MNINNIFPSRLMFGAAIVGIVGAAGVYIYEQLYAEKKRTVLVNEVARLDKQVTIMKQELESIRELQKQAHIRRLEHKKARQKRQRQANASTAPVLSGGGDTVDGREISYTSDSEYYTDYQSLGGTDGEMDSEEFYDVHTDEDDDTLRDDVVNGHLVNDEDLPAQCVAPESLPRNGTKK